MAINTMLAQVPLCFPQVLPAWLGNLCLKFRDQFDTACVCHSVYVTAQLPPKEQDTATASHYYTFSIDKIVHMRIYICSPSTFSGDAESLFLFCASCYEPSFEILGCVYKIKSRHCATSRLFSTSPKEEFSK